MTHAVFTIEEVKGRSSYTCFPKERNNYKGQLVLLADLVAGRKERAYRAPPGVIAQVDGDCYKIQWVSFLQLDIWMNCLLCN